MKYPKIVFVLLLAFLSLAAGALAYVPAPSAPRVSALDGRLLVAGRRMADPNFTRCVVFMVAHTEEGAIGLVINRIYGSITLRHLFGELGIQSGLDRKVDLHYGGPVQFGVGFVLHSADFTGHGTQLFRNGISLSTDPDVVRAVAAGHGPKQAIFIAGYSGWAAGQLEREISRGDWLIAPADPDLIFSEHPETVWEKALQRAGIFL